MAQTMARRRVPDEERPDWSRRIRAKRQARGLSQDALGAELGVSQSAVADWEMGTSVPRGDTVPRLAAALGCDPAEISPHTAGNFAESQELNPFVADDLDHQFAAVLVWLHRGVTAADPSVSLLLIAKWAARIWRISGGAAGRAPDAETVRQLVEDQVHVVQATIGGRRR